MNPHTSSQVTLVTDNFNQMLFGNNMLTTKRAQTAQDIHGNSNRRLDHLEGSIGGNHEDWHAKICLSSKSFFCTKKKESEYKFWQFPPKYFPRNP